MERKEAKVSRWCKYFFKGRGYGGLGMGHRSLTTETQAKTGHGKQKKMYKFKKSDYRLLICITNYLFILFFCFVPKELIKRKGKKGKERRGNEVSHLDMYICNEGP